MPKRFHGLRRELAAFKISFGLNSTNENSIHFGASWDLLMCLSRPPIWSNLFRRNSQDNRASPIKGPSCLLRRGKSTEHLDSSCTFAYVWWVAYRRKAVVGSKTSYTLARSNQNSIHIAGVRWKLHAHWSKPTLVDGLAESSKRTSVKSPYALCAISSNKTGKMLLYKYMCILQLYYFSAFENS